MRESKGQTQLDFAIATLTFFIFFGFVVMSNPSPIYGFGGADNSLKMDSHQTAVNIAENELQNEQGVITDEKVNNLMQSGVGDDMIISQNDVDANITLSNADNPGGSPANTGKLPPVLQSKNTVGNQTPPVGTVSSTQIVAIDGKLVEIKVKLWRK